MMDDGPDWTRPWSVPAILWNSCATFYLPLRLYMRAGDWLLFHLWLATRGIVWRLEDGIGATGSTDLYLDGEKVE